MTAPATSGPGTTAPRSLVANPLPPGSPPANPPVTVAPTRPAPVVVTSPLPVGSLPSVPTAHPSLSPASGNAAASLFPTLAPKPSAASSGSKARTRPVADTSAFPEGEPIANAQLAGLAALVLAFVLAVTRLSIRRRPAAKPEPGPDPDSKPESGSDAESKPGPDSESKPELDPKPQSGAETADKPDADKADKPGTSGKGTGEASAPPANDE
jgi:hypothetical protein